MAIQTEVRYWRDITVDMGLRPNIVLQYTNGIWGGIALKNKIFLAEFLWPAVAPGAVEAFNIFELTVTASGTQDLITVEQGKKKRTDGSIRIMEVLRGESVVGAKMYTRTPLNENQIVHPNDAIGVLNPDLLQIFGWDYLSEDSPFRNPTEASRVMVVDSQKVEFAMRNDNPFAVRNTTNFILNVIDFKPFNPQTTFGAERLAGMLRGKIPKTGWTPGVGRSDIVDATTIFGVPPVFYDGENVRLNSESGAVIG